MGGREKGSAGGDGPSLLPLLLLLPLPLMWMLGGVEWGHEGGRGRPRHLLEAQRP